MVTAPPLTVRCPSCSASFPVDPAKVPEHGVAAICSACMRVFRVAVPEEARLPAEPPAARAAAVEGEPGPHVEPREEPDGVESGAAPEVEPGEAPAAVAEEPLVEAAPGEAVDADPPGSGPPGAAAEAPSPPPPAPPPAPAAFEDLTSLASEAAAERASEGGATTGAADLSQGAERFGRRDPHERARRLARVLVSDIIAYYPVRYQESLARGTLREDFRDEIRKSWKEYVDQVGQEMAEGTPYFTEALNRILARGEEVF